MEQETIQVNFLKATKQNIFTLLFFAIGISYFAFVNFYTDITCSYILGINVAYLTMLFFTLVAPCMFLFLSIIESRKGYKIIKYGYNPPLGTYNYFKEGISKNGKGAKIQGYISFVVVPVFSIIFLVIGIYIYYYFFGSVTYSEIISEFEVVCNNA